MTLSVCRFLVANTQTKHSIPCRKSYLSNANNASKHVYDVQSVYTFDFYQHLLDAANYELDLGVKKIKLAKILDGQPLQVLAMERGGEPAWKVQLWHESLLKMHGEKAGED